MLRFVGVINWFNSSSSTEEEPELPLLRYSSRDNAPLRGELIFLKSSTLRVPANLSLSSIRIVLGGNVQTVGLGDTLPGETRPDIGVIAGERDIGEFGVRDC